MAKFIENMMIHPANRLTEPFEPFEWGSPVIEALDSTEAYGIAEDKANEFMLNKGFKLGDFYATNFTLTEL